jgi:hypothetical protein
LSVRSKADRSTTRPPRAAMRAITPPNRITGRAYSE